MKTIDNFWLLFTASQYKSLVTIQLIQLIRLSAVLRQQNQTTSSNFMQSNYSEPHNEAHTTTREFQSNNNNL